MGASMSGYIDCHCHISSEDFDKDLDEVIENSRKAGVVALVAVAEHSGEFEKIINLSQRFPGFIFPCLGVHPVQQEKETQRSVTTQDLQGALPILHKYRDHIVAIGEVGLDFTPRFLVSDEDKEAQREVLRRQAEVAKHLDLPLNVHSRSAGRPTIHLLKELGGLEDGLEEKEPLQEVTARPKAKGVQKALLHAFDGKPSVALEGVRQGFMFSIPPSIIRSDQKQRLVKQLPLENICLETDSPALGPEKQVRNEPQNIRVAAEFVSKVKGVSLERVMEQTTHNALKLFNNLRL